MITYFHDSDDIGNGVFTERLYAAAEISASGYNIELIRTRAGREFAMHELSSRDRAALQAYFTLWVLDLNLWRYA
jgi:hypothetical protein